MEEKLWDWAKSSEVSEFCPSKFLPYLSERWKFNNFGRFLDTQCGFGSNAIYMASKGFTAYAMDSSSYALNQADKKSKLAGTNIILKEGSPLELPFEDDSFDCIFSDCSGLAMNFKESRHMIDELCRVMVPGAEAFVTFNSKNTYEYINPKNSEQVDRNTVLVFTNEAKKNGRLKYFVNFKDLKGLFFEWEILDKPVEWTNYQNVKDNKLSTYFSILIRKRLDYHPLVILPI